MLRSSALRTSRCILQVSRTKVIPSTIVRPLSNVRLPLQEETPINPIEMLLAKDPMGWPKYLKPDLLSFEQAFLGVEPVAPTVPKPKDPNPPTASLKAASAEVMAILRDMYVALNSAEVAPTVQAYIQLKTHDALEKISEADIIKITQVLVDFLERSPPCQTRTDAEDMAVYFAARGSLEPLNSAMAWNLREDEFQTIYSLWHSYLREKRGKSMNFTITKQRRGQKHALLYFVAAAAARDDYKSVVMALCTHTGTNVPSWTITEFADKHLLTKQPAIRQRFCDFLHDAALSRDIRYFQPLADQVVELARLSDSQTLKSLYGSIKEGLERKIFVTRLVQSSDNELEPFVPQYIELKVWSLLIWGAVEARQPKLADFLVEEMKSYGVEPNIDIYNTLLYGSGKQGRIEKMMDIIRTVKEVGLRPNIRSFSITMTALFDARRPNQALEIFEAIKGYPVEPGEEEILLATYNIALNGLLRDRQIEQGHELLNEMQDQGPKPDIVTFNTLLNRYTHMKDRAGTAQILRAIADAGLKPDIYTFTILYVGACRNKDEGVKEDLLKRMKSLEVKPNRTLLSAAIHSILNNGSIDSIVIALQLLERMEKDHDKNVQPNEVTYSTIMNALDQMAEKGKISVPRAYEYVTGLYQKMLARGFHPNRPILHILMRVNLRHSGIESLRTALALFDEIVEAEVDNSDSWYLILQGLETRKEFVLAKEKVNQLMRSRLEPRGSLLILLDRISRY